jgi:hypothetical protein
MYCTAVLKIPEIFWKQHHGRLQIEVFPYGNKALGNFKRELDTLRRRKPSFVDADHVEAGDILIREHRHLFLF